MKSFYYENYFWADSHDVEKEKYTCGYCNSLAAPTYGYLTYKYNEGIVPKSAEKWLDAVRFKW